MAKSTLAFLLIFTLSLVSIALAIEHHELVKTRAELSARIDQLETLSKWSPVAENVQPPCPEHGPWEKYAKHK